MRRLLLGAFSFVIIFGFLCTCPAAALVGPEPGVSRAGNTPLDDCQKTFTEALRFIEREQEYASEKARYQQATAKVVSPRVLGVRSFCPAFRAHPPFLRTDDYRHCAICPANVLHRGHRVTLSSPNQGDGLILLRSLLLAGSYRRRLRAVRHLPPSFACTPSHLPDNTSRTSPPWCP